MSVVILFAALMPGPEVRPQVVQSDRWRHTQDFQLQESLPAHRIPLVVILFNSITFHLYTALNESIDHEYSYLEDRIATIANAPDSLSDATVAELLDFESDCYSEAKSRVAEYLSSELDIDWLADKRLFKGGLYAACTGDDSAACSRGAIVPTNLPASFYALDTDVSCEHWWQGTDGVAGLEQKIEESIKDSLWGEYAWIRNFWDRDGDATIRAVVQFITDQVSSTKPLAVIPGEGELSWTKQLATTYFAGGDLLSSGIEAYGINLRIARTIPALQALALASLVVVLPLAILVAIVNPSYLISLLVYYSALHLWPIAATIGSQLHDLLWVLVIGDTDLSLNNILTTLSASGNSWLWFLTSSFSWSVPLLFTFLAHRWAKLLYVS